MALAIKAIPTLYGEETREFRERADEVERRFMERPRRNLNNDPKILAELSEDLGEAMVGINEQEIELLMAERGK